MGQYMSPVDYAAQGCLVLSQRDLETMYLIVLTENERKHVR